MRLCLYLKRTIAKFWLMVCGLFWLLAIASNTYAFTTSFGLTVHAGSDNSYTLPTTRGEIGNVLRSSEDDYSVLEWRRPAPIMLFETTKAPTATDSSVDTILGAGNISAWGCTEAKVQCVVSKDVTLRVCIRYHGDTSGSSPSGYIHVEDENGLQEWTFILKSVGELGGATSCTTLSALAGEDVSLRTSRMSEAYPDGSLQQITLEQIEYD